MMKHLLAHFFFPRESNNYRAKLLHHTLLLVLIFLLLSLQFGLLFVKNTSPQVLGMTAQFTVQDLLLLTNIQRQQAGVGVLQLNDQLAYAAGLKAHDMLSKNYWAHNSPSGDTPWVFIKRAGYSYTYAGENLARGFSNGQELINAWMASPSHRENMLSSHYNDVGFAIVSGNLLQEDTVLVVEMFGARQPKVLAETNIDIQPSPTSTPQPVISPFVTSTITPIPLTTVNNHPPIDTHELSLRIVFILLGILILALIVDMITIRKKQIVRVAGHNLDHIIWLLMVGGIVVLLLSGKVL